MTTDSGSHNVLAWCGWRLQLPAAWRPLRIYGDGRAGSMIVGDSNSSIFRIRWQQIQRKTPDPLKWRAQRTRVLGPGLSARNVFDASLPDFPAAVRVESERGWVWQGIAPSAGLVLEIAPEAAADDALRRTVGEDVLPSLQVAVRGRPVEWCIFGTRFRTPPGYRLTRYRLHLGDMALELAARRHGRLVVRQIYPAELALQRRPLRQWVEISPFETRRRLRRAVSSPHGLSFAGAAGTGGSCEIVVLRGESRIPWPFGFIRPRKYVGAGVLDPDADRIFVAEAELFRGDPDATLRRVMEGMTAPESP